MEYLEHTFSVGSSDIDIWGHIKPTAILNICQEAAYMHSTQAGFGYKKLSEIGAAWVLSRAKVTIERSPAWDEQIKVRTWHKGQSGLFSLRDYIFYDAQDIPILYVTTSWLIINLTTRRLMRVDRIFDSKDQLQLLEYNHDAIATEAERIEMPTEQFALGEHHVRYSDMDVNQHVNNTRYLEWACDHSAQQMLPERRLSSLCINFNHEAKYNECVSLQGSEPAPDKLLIEGTIGGRSIFCVELNYCDQI